MGQKVHPTGFRIGVIQPWQARWYADHEYRELLHEDIHLRDFVNKRHINASISQIDIERVADKRVTVTIHTAKPGILIGRSGQNVEELRKALEALTKKTVRVDILEVRQPDATSILVARSIAEQLVKRIAFKRAMKQAVQKAMQLETVKGIRVAVAGRLGGAEMSRREWERKGRVPLQTLRANIDYGFAEAHTTYGVIGVKVWIYKGDIKRGQMVQTDDVAPSANRGDAGARRDRNDRPRRPGTRPGGTGRPSGPRRDASPSPAPATSR